MYKEMNENIFIFYNEIFFFFFNPLNIIHIWVEHAPQYLHYNTYYQILACIALATDLMCVYANDDTITKNVKSSTSVRSIIIISI